MKLAGARARAFASRPGADVRGALIYGPDPTMVAEARRALVAAVTEGDELRLTRLAAREAARDPAAIDAALRAQGFFPGRRLVLIEEAGDALAAPLREVLRATSAEDAFLLVTAAVLPARSSLRRLFEEATDLAALGLWPEATGPQELRSRLAASGLSGKLTPEAEETLLAFATTAEPAVLSGEIEKLALLALDAPSPLDEATVAALLPGAAAGGIDALVGAVASGRPGEVGPLMTRLAGAGVQPVAMLTATARYFRRLFRLAVDPEGPEKAIGRLRPPVFGPRRKALLTELGRWRAARLEAAQRLLFEADRRVRSPGQRPDRALVERTLIRVAMLAEGR